MDASLFFKTFFPYGLRNEKNGMVFVIDNFDGGFMK